jgi:diaminopimelate epimerase
MSTRQNIPFFKMQGSGNDFVLIDNRSLQIPVEHMASWAKTFCPRAFSVGADGLIFLQEAPSGDPADYIWHFYNADGSRAEMCGNGSRCAAFLAHRLGLAGAEHVLGTDAGPIRAKVYPELEEVQVQLTPVRQIQTGIDLDMDGTALTVHFANTGVPHAIVIMDAVHEANVLELGRSIRRHQHFSPAGTNVNFIQMTGRNSLLLRTYERGVENETYACGTGAAASVAIAHALDLVDDSVLVTTSGGERLEILIQGENIHLKGRAVLVYEGRFLGKQPQKP